MFLIFLSIASKTNAHAHPDLNLYDKRRRCPYQNSCLKFYGTNLCTRTTQRKLIQHLINTVFAPFLSVPAVLFQFGVLGDRVQRGSAGEGNHRCPQSALPSLGRDLHRGLLETTLALETKTRTVDEHVLRPDDSSTAEETADHFFSHQGLLCFLMSGFGRKEKGNISLKNKTLRFENVQLAETHRCSQSVSHNRLCWRGIGTGSGSVLKAASLLQSRIFASTNGTTVAHCRSWPCCQPAMCELNSILPPSVTQGTCVNALKIHYPASQLLIGKECWRDCLLERQTVSVAS